LSKRVFLDTSVLGYVTHPRPGDEGKACKQWLARLLRAGVHICVPEICDYELRREYEHLNATRALANLDALSRNVSYIAIDTPAMRRAAELWGEARRAGQPTADPKDLDGDVIACAQAMLEAGEDEFVFATTNIGHLSRFVAANAWRDITP